MSAPAVWSGTVHRQASPARRSRSGWFQVGIALLLLLSTATPVEPQSDARWSFENDAFAELWFHGLAVLGFHGFGPMPLYDPSYAMEALAGRHEAGHEPTMLERKRGELLASLQRDEAFEVLHFVPLYFSGASVDASLKALSAVATQAEGSPPLPPETRMGGSVVASVLTSPAQRRTLELFVGALEREWRQVLLPRRARGEEGRTRALRERWSREWAPPLAGFLSAEGFQRGSVYAVPSLGAEGRFLESHPATGGQPLVAVGIGPGDDGIDAALGSLVREMCYPAVRRAFGPFEARFYNRVEASRASDLTATRCGELLLEELAPDKLAVYRARFGLPPEGSGPGFLSASGTLTGAAPWEGQLEAALLRELNLDPDGARALSGPSGGN